MGGYVVGVIANNPMFGGIMDYKAARKQAHFVELCDLFNIPLIFFADIPGFMIGPESEANAVLRDAFPTPSTSWRIRSPRATWW